MHNGQMQYHHSKKQRFLLLLLIIGIILFHFLTTLQGQSWGDDFALFLLHAKNIVEGNSYSETGFIFNPLSLSYSPQNYPPGFPLLISPLYKIFQLNFFIYHLFITCFFAGMLWLSYLLVRKYFSFYYAIAFIIVLGMSPYLWSLRNNVLSDFPATFFLMLAIFIELKRDTSNNKLLPVAEGLAMYISFSMRSSGIVLLPALLYRYFFKKKRKDNYFPVIIIVFLIPYILQSFLMPSEGGHLNMMKLNYEGLSLQKIMNDFFFQVNRYVDDFRYFTLVSGINRDLNIAFSTICFTLFLAGWYLFSRKRLSFIDVFIILFFGLIFVWPFFQGIRYLLPVLPFYVFFSIYAVQSIDSATFRKVLAGTCILCTCIVYNGFYSTTHYGTLKYGVNYSSNQEMFNYIKTNTEPDAVIMSTKPRAFTLLTGRKGIVYPDAKHWDKYETCLSENKVGYIVTGGIDYNDLPVTAAKEDTSVFQLIFSNSDLALYKVNHH
ncbi:MAG: ArnT family glycosyltransferase [Chitinophagales bacterium]